MTIERCCCACGRPIVPGETRWAGREPQEFWHYACWERVQVHVENNQGGVAGRRNNTPQLKAK